MSVKNISGSCCGPKQALEPEQPVQPEKEAGSCCGSKQQPEPVVRTDAAWNLKYFAVMAILAALWLLAYRYILPASSWLVFDVLGVAQDSHAGAALEFFIYDTVKILLLLAALIYGIAWLRASMDMDRVRDYLTGKRRGVGLFSGFGIWCSDSFLFLLQRAVVCGFYHGPDSDRYQHGFFDHFSVDQ